MASSMLSTRTPSWSRSSVPATARPYDVDPTVARRISPGYGGFMSAARSIFVVPPDPVAEAAPEGQQALRPRPAPGVREAAPEGQQALRPRPAPGVREPAPLVAQRVERIERLLT